MIERGSTGNEEKVGSTTPEQGVGKGLDSIHSFKATSAYARTQGKQHKGYLL